jgi:hypothetical protein
MHMFELFEFDLNSIDKIKKKSIWKFQKRENHFQPVKPRSAQLAAPRALSPADRWTPPIGATFRSLARLPSICPVGPPSQRRCAFSRTRSRGPCPSEPSPSPATATPMAGTPRFVKPCSRTHDPPMSLERLGEDPAPPLARPCLSFTSPISRAHSARSAATAVSRRPANQSPLVSCQAAPSTVSG